MRIAHTEGERMKQEQTGKRSKTNATDAANKESTTAAEIDARPTDDEQWRTTVNLTPFAFFSSIKVKSVILLNASASSKCAAVSRASQFRLLKKRVVIQEHFITVVVASWALSFFSVHYLHLQNRY